MQCPRCEGRAALPRHYRASDGWDVVGPAWNCLLCGHRWPRGTGQVVAEKPEESKRDKLAKAARAHWAGMSPEQRKAQTRGICGPHARGKPKKGTPNG